jgi:hypothetical protein
MVAVPVTEAQVRRAVKGALDAGFAIGAVEIKKDGTILILPDNEEKTQDDTRKPKDW